MNKASLIIFFISFCAVGVGWVYPDYSLNTAHIIFRISGIYILLSAGTFYVTRLFKLIGISLALVCVGVLFKIQHYSGASLIMTSGMTSMVIFYLIHFLRKTPKGAQDYAKMLFVWLLPIGAMFQILHFPYGMEISLFTSVLLIYLVVNQVLRERVDGSPSI